MSSGIIKSRIGWSMNISLLCLCWLWFVLVFLWVLSWKKPGKSKQGDFQKHCTSRVSTSKRYHHCQTSIYWSGCRIQQIDCFLRYYTVFCCSPRHCYGEIKAVSTNTRLHQNHTPYFFTRSTSDRDNLFNSLSLSINFPLGALSARTDGGRGSL